MKIPWVLIICFCLCSEGTSENIDADNPPKWLVPDIKNTLHESKRKAVWKATTNVFFDSKFYVSIGPCFYTDKFDEVPDYYTIEVSYIVSKDKILTCYSRDFKIDQLPEGFLKKQFHDIVSFDEKKKTVKFYIDDKVFIYKLPNAPVAKTK